MCGIKKAMLKIIKVFFPKRIFRSFSKQISNVNSTFWLEKTKHSIYEKKTSKFRMKYIFGQICNKFVNFLSFENAYPGKLKI